MTIVSKDSPRAGCDHRLPHSRTRFTDSSMVLALRDLSELRALGQIDVQASPSDVRFRSQQVNVQHRLSGKKRG
jgi:hypothetical protein